MSNAEMRDAELSNAGEIIRAIRALEDRRYQAMTDADVATLDELLSDDLVYGHSDATRDTKQSYLDKVASGYFDYGPLSHPEAGIVVHGDVAVVTGDMRGEVQVQGQVRVLNSSALAVWARAGGRWALLAFQPTKYPGEPGTAAT
jgi:ketosteroid isomerase-like protein